MKQFPTKGLLAAALLAGAPLAGAVDLNWAGFATAGYARSDRDFTYDRFISERGTLRRDSIVGAQLDASINERWSLALQATVAPSKSDDSRTEVSMPWAVLSYRAANDTLLRVGRLRVPMYLNSENMEVGTSFDLMRLPSEVYATAPTMDFQGASVSQSWDIGTHELALEAYAGQGTMFQRQYSREGFPASGGAGGGSGGMSGAAGADAPAGGGSGALSAGAHFGRSQVGSRGIVFTLRNGQDQFRAGYHRFAFAEPNGSPLVFDYTSGSTGSGGGHGDITSRILTVGANVGLGGSWRLTGELARRDVDQVHTGYNSTGAYLMLQTKVGAWTPYLSQSRLLTHAADRERYRAVLADTSNPYSHAAADFLAPFDQSTTSLGVAYASSPTSKWKANLMRVRVGEGSGLVDSPAGAPPVRQTGIRVLSLSYNVAF